jgi:hypothetical protein
MHHILRGAAVIILAFLVLPGYAADEKDKDKDKKAPDAKKDGDKNAQPDVKKDVDKKAPDAKKDHDKKDSPWVKAGQVAGTIVNINESSKGIRLKVDVPELNPSAVQGLANAQLQLANAKVQLAQAGLKPPQERLQAIINAQNAIAQAQQNVANQQAHLYNKKPMEFELSTTEDLVVRLNEPPPKFDDKGKKVKYTAKELKALKGDNPKLPGYQAEFSDLRSNQLVQVTLVRNKNAPKPKPINPKNKSKDADAELLLDDNKPHISMIMVLGEKPAQ